MLYHGLESNESVKADFMNENPDKKCFEPDGELMEKILRCTINIAANKTKRTPAVNRKRSLHRRPFMMMRVLFQAENIVKDLLFSFG